MHPTILVLVHGTYAPNAPWTKDDSKLVEAVRSHLQGSVISERILWTGRNTISARRKAAQSLLMMMESIRRDHPNSAIYLVGHSHGGSAIAYALKADKGLAEMVSGCVFLSTPFIAASVSHRACTDLILLLGLLLFGWVTIGLGLVLGLALWALFRNSVFDSYPGGLAYFLSVLVGIPLGLRAHRAVLRADVGSGGSATAWLQGRAKAQCIHIDSATIPDSLRRLVLRSVADEAAIALVVAQAAAMSMSVLRSVSAVPLSFASRFLQKVARQRFGGFAFGIMLIGLCLVSTTGTLRQDS